MFFVDSIIYLKTYRSGSHQLMIVDVVDRLDNMLVCKLLRVVGIAVEDRLKDSAVLRVRVSCAVSIR